MTGGLLWCILCVLIRLIHLTRTGKDVSPTLQLNHRDSRPIYEQIADGMRRMILSGVYQPDEKLPSVRDLAASMAINPNTIARAYRELEAEGYIYTVSGRGAFCGARDTAAQARTQALLEQLAALVGELKTLNVRREVYLSYWEEADEHDPNA